MTGEGQKKHDMLYGQPLAKKNPSEKFQNTAKNKNNRVSFVSVNNRKTAKITQDLKKTGGNHNDVIVNYWVLTKRHDTN